jgi:anaerobic dimethyl sulfoxide reductase subunit B (iron-sulfur subunit)
MSEYGLLIEYNYCTGCYSCEVACQMEHGFATDEWGIKLAKIGPWQISEDKWQLDYIPVPTDQCDLCADRVAKGKKPTCVKHCQSLVMSYGTIDELAEIAKTKTKTVLFAPK